MILIPMRAQFFYFRFMTFFLLTHCMVGYVSGGEPSTGDGRVGQSERSSKSRHDDDDI